MTTETYQQQSIGHPYRCGNHRRKNHVVFGTFIILIGLFILGKRLGLFFMPFHLWPVILLAVGIYSGIKHRFTNFGSWALILLGILFIIPRFFFFGVWSTHLAAPMILISLGIYLIVRPRGKFRAYQGPITSVVDDDTINLEVSFGERTASVTSKNFKGGSISNSFGSTRINLLQADAAEPMILDLSVSFGSVEILVPSHWEVKLEVDSSLASVEDKRYLRVSETGERKTLVLRGSCSFGSITVKSI